MSETAACMTYLFHISKDIRATIRTTITRNNGIAIIATITGVESGPVRFGSCTGGNWSVGLPPAQSTKGSDTCFQRTILNHSPALALVLIVCMDMVPTLDDDVGRVQTVENMPVVSQKASEELIRRVQSPGSVGDSSSFRVQLGPTLTWNVLPTVGSTALPSRTLPSTCNQKQALYTLTAYVASSVLGREVVPTRTHTCSTVLACCQKTVLAVSIKFLCQGECQMLQRTLSDVYN